MPLYELKDGAVNKVDIGESIALVKNGNAPVMKEIFETISDDKPSILVVDGWYGVEWIDLKTHISNEASKQSIDIEFFETASLFIDTEKLTEYNKKYLTDDPSFGWVNDDGVLDDVLSQSAIENLIKQLKIHKEKGKGIFCIIGVGAYNAKYSDYVDKLIYADFTMQPLLWKMWDGKLIPFGATEPDASYFWKRYYYNDFYLLYRQKKLVFNEMNLYLDAVDVNNLKLMDKTSYNKMIDELVKKPIKQVKIFQPGPWGAYRFKDFWDVKGLSCSAWNELAGIELSVLIDVGDGCIINIPAQNFMQRPLDIVGKYVHETYPDLMPLQVWFDDGYFPEPVPFERSSMTVHNHPGSDYNKEHFNEPIGRYETYYICEAYKNSTTWMGYKNNADLEEWERLIKDSNNQKVIPNWQDFFKRWDTNVGDLFLIVPGTDHGHGGNQQVLEMDTCPSVCGTEYSFFGFDFARDTWDDKTKTMTGNKTRMHMEHFINNNKWIKEDQVASRFRARPIVLSGNGKTRKDQYTTVEEMPFHIERLSLEKEVENDTEGKFMHIATLTEGHSVTIQSKENPKYETTIERYQAVVVPASFGKHIYKNNEGNHAMIVIIRLKKG